MEYFIINTAVASIYKEPTHKSEMVTQALYGESCKIVEEKDDWYNIQQWDGYEGWIYNFNGIIADEEYDANCVLNDLNGEIIDEHGNVITKIVFGTKLNAEKDDYGYKIKLPNSEKAFSDNAFSSNPQIATRENIVEIANRFSGVPYLWGGKTPYGMDCSGLVQTVFKSVGIGLPRDANQQAKTLRGYRIAKNELQKGDLLFFGDKEKITHVAISVGGLNFINARGYVRVESIDEKNSQYNSKLRNLFLHAISVKELLD